MASLYPRKKNQMKNLKKPVYVWKIRNMLTGEFHNGGSTPGRFSKSGKFWTAIGHLKTHIRMITGQQHYQECFSGPGKNLNGSATWEIVKYELVEVETIPYDALIPEKNLKNSW